MDIGSEISITISVLAVCITVVFGTAIWRKNSLDELRAQKNDVEKQRDACERELATARDENRWLNQRLRKLEDIVADRRMGGTDGADG